MGQDLYTQWLGIAPGPRPPDYYALLGLERFCQDIEAIEQATRARLTRLDEFAMHPDRDTRDRVQDMMNAVARARVCLVHPAKRGAYDQRLRGGAAAPAGAAQVAVAPAAPLPRRESVFEQGEPVFAQDEPALTGTGPAGRAPEADPTIRAFEALVWKHLGRWKLGPQEERLLVAEAADLGIADAAARRIIRKIDRAAEARAESRHKWTVGIVVGSACLFVAGLSAFLLISNWRTQTHRDREARFTEALAAARDSMARDDLDGAGRALAEARGIFPDDPNCAALAGELAQRVKLAGVKAFAEALASARQCLARKDLNGADRALAEARRISPDDPKCAALAGELASARAKLATGKAFEEALASARDCLAFNDLGGAEAALAGAGEIDSADPRYVALRGELDQARTVRKLLDEAQALLSADKAGDAAAQVAKALAIRPGDAEALAMKTAIDKRLAPPPPPAPLPRELTLDLGGGVSMKFVLIPAGKFMMGSPAGEKDRAPNEMPQHEVTITRPFQIGVFEVTLEQYQQVMGFNPDTRNDIRCPVNGINWDNAIAFCRRLSEKTGQRVSLPTEAQWEYACRAGTTTRFNFGDSDADIGEYEWAGNTSQSDAHPVGQKKPNAFGLFDIHGNVAELCRDSYAEPNTPGLLAAVDPFWDDPNCRQRVFRGGAYGSPSYYARSSRRCSCGRREGGSKIGFRVVVEPVGSDKALTAEQEAEFVKLLAVAEKLVTAWPADPNQMTPPQKAEVYSALETINSALAIRPNHPQALAYAKRIDDVWTGREKRLMAFAQQITRPSAATRPAGTTQDAKSEAPAGQVRAAWSDDSETNYLLADIALTIMANHERACRLAGKECPAAGLLGKMLTESEAAKRIDLLMKTANSTADPNSDSAKPKTVADFRRMLSRGTRLQQWEAIEALRDANTAEAVAALLEHVETAAKAATLTPQIASACQALRALPYMTDKSIPERLINALATCPNDVFAYRISGALSEGFGHMTLGAGIPSSFGLDRNTFVGLWRQESKRGTWNRTPVAARAKPAPLSSKPRSYSPLDSGAAAMLLVVAADNAEAMAKSLRTISPAGKPPSSDKPGGKLAADPAGEAFVTASQVAADELGRLARSHPAAAKFASQLDSIAATHKSRTLACVSQFQQAAVAMDTQGAYLAAMIRMLDVEGRLTDKLNELAQRRKNALAGAANVLLEIREAGYNNLLLWDMLLQYKGANP